VARATASGGPAAGARALGTLLRNLLLGARDLALWPLEARVPREWVVLPLTRGLAEVPVAPSWLAALRPAPPTLLQAIEACERAARDPRVRGVLVRVGHAPLGWSQVSSLARALAELRAAGRTVVVYATAAGNAGAWLGSLADQFWMPPEGRLELVGVRVSSRYFRGTLDRLEIRSQVQSAGRYKSIGEQLTRERMSEPAREMLDAVVDGLYSSLVDGLAAGAAGDAETARRWVDEGPYRASEAHELGLVHALVYGDELASRLARLAGHEEEDAEAKPLGLAPYLRVSRPRLRWTPLATGPQRIAVVPLAGMLRRSSASPRGLVGLLRRLERDASVRAVVLRIDCPGGDALASDLLWRAVRKLVERKPVVASFGDVAASGGYYVGMAANEIVAEPTTLTGSIGVALAWVEIDSFLESLGVTSDAVERGRHAGIYDLARARSLEERQLLRRQVEQTYRTFVHKAAESRGLPEAELEQVAQGRVWTGAQAAERGLVDHLGGVGTAIERARALAGLAPDEGQVMALGLARSPLAQWLGSDPGELFGGSALLCPISIPLH
jgi:protease-4